MFYELEFSILGSSDFSLRKNWFLRAGSLIHNEKKQQLFSLRETAMQLRSQRPLHVQVILVAGWWTRKE
jgi:hypothetical protein